MRLQDYGDVAQLVRALARNTTHSHVLGIGIDIKSSQQTLVSPGHFL